MSVVSHVYAHSYATTFHIHACVSIRTYTWLPQAKVERMMGDMTPTELDDFLVLLRSLSIAYEQHRTAWSSEYIVKFVKKQVPICKCGCC